ncbi:MAG: hypothetical protein HDS62_08370 [Bacteroidales bacterium]|nr:hypothetical protein [Bacteroidales bacterium]
MMEVAYTRDVTERNRALESLAKMKELEAKRKAKMKTVRLDTRTVVTATKNALKAKMEQFRKENPISAGCASRAEKYRKQRREILKECFEEHPTLSKPDLYRIVRKVSGKSSSATSSLILSALRDGDLRFLNSDDKIYTLNI